MWYGFTLLGMFISKRAMSWQAEKPVEKAGLLVVRV
jgi:hypothetical protein